MAGRDSDCLWKQRGARPGKQREETALHPDPEMGGETGKRVRGEENQNDPLPLTAAWNAETDNGR